MKVYTVNKRGQRVMETKTRFKTAADWVRASAPDATQEYVDAVSGICKKQKGVWTVLRNPPKDLDRAVVWHAYMNEIHMVNWGDLAAWSERVTIMLMRANQEQRQLFDKIQDETVSLAVARSKRK